MKKLMVRPGAPKMLRPLVPGSNTCVPCRKPMHVPSTGWVPRSFAWCRLCGLSFKGHQGCIAGLVEARDKHEETCRHQIPQTRLRCE